MQLLLFLSGVIQALIFKNVFSNSTNINITKIPPVGAELYHVTSRRLGMYYEVTSQSWQLFVHAKNIQTINLCIIHPLLAPGLSSVMDCMKFPSEELCSTSRSFRLS